MRLASKAHPFSRAGRQVPLVVKWAAEEVGDYSAASKARLGLLTRKKRAACAR